MRAFLESLALDLPPSNAGLATATHPRKVSLIYFNAGGGHRAAARALQSELARQCPDWQVTLVDLFQVLDPQQRFKRATGFAPEAYYNKRLATGFTLGLAPELKLLQAMIRMSHKQLVGRLVKYWHHTEPSMVVSLVPNFNRSISTSIKRVNPHVPFVTVMTDLADYPPNFWVEPGYTQHLICGTEHAAAQAIAQGVDNQRVYQTSGMVLSPRFYDQDKSLREQLRQELGFKSDEAVGVVMFGGHGSAVMKRIATALVDRPLILICGRNEALKLALEKLPSRAVRHVVGFTDDVARWMRAADYFIGKPGPGSISEALHCGLPVIVTRNVWTMPQERWNTDWVQQRRVGRVIPSVTKINEAVQDVIANIHTLRQSVASMPNGALFEVVDILQGIAQGHAVPAGSVGTQLSYS
jgi:UDP-N-acetylglucosamine:LPS N-acetylglucosamine transferase